MGDDQQEDPAAERVARLGRWLEEVRQRWGWSRVQLQAAAKVSPRHQVTMMSGGTRSVQRDTLLGIAAATGVSEQDLWSLMEGGDLPIPDMPATPLNGLQDSSDEVAELRREVRDLRLDVEVLSRRVAQLLARDAGPPERSGP